ncbi:hypothetical protein [Sphingobacterium kitahiroshimense]|uniref:hypothetical protein n=1 Tax=Sphingobacterium kitahiroshimense TaxID=470446 RepID=UPI00320800D1
MKNFKKIAVHVLRLKKPADALDVTIQCITSSAGLESLSKLVAKYKLVIISRYDSNVAVNIHLPKATAQNKGRGVQICANASYGSVIHVNDYSFVITCGTGVNYESNGEKWIPVKNFSFHVG